MRNFWAIKEIRVAILVIGTLALVYIGLSYLRGRDVLSRPMQVKAEYVRINGLNTGDPVLLNGYQVGKVNETRMDPKTYRITALFDIERRIKLPNNTVAVIAAINLFGDKGIMLLPGDGKEMLRDGDLLQDSLEVALTDKLQSELAPVVENLNDAIANVNGVFTSLDAVLRDTLKFQRMTSEIGQVAHNFALASGYITSVVIKMDSTASSLRSMLANLEAQNEKIDRIMANTGVVTDSLAAASSDLKTGITNLKNTLAQLDAFLTQVNQGEGSLGKLANNDSLYTNLNNTAESLNRLLIDFREHPKRYVHFSVFGRKERTGKENKGNGSN